MELIIATHNKNKVSEFQRILAPLDVKVSAAKLPEVDETGKTFAENAYIKATSACRATGMAAVADDSGLSVDALGGAPGVYSARYAGDGATDEDRINKLLQNLKNVPVNSRTAKFVCSICCVFPNGDKITAQGECRGKIAFEPRGSDGFGYDPVFLVGDSTFAEISGEEKDKISHRGKALRIFAEKLKKYKGAIYAEQ
ncbi:MAG TPA: non-canonical purine NTP pyrophosphatase [Ruminococcaceae bacterium]|jgi:XTP/dITP diphosphohydrolase|nr:non-canonical purine NTP pyrophosphatase [Oscillospiraceae bacterium]